MKLARVSLLLAVLMLAALPARAQTVTVLDTTISRAKDAFDQIASGKLDRSSLTPALNDDMTDDVRQYQTTQATALGGQPRSFVPVAQTDVDGVTTTIFRLHFATGNLDFNFGLDDKTDKIAKLYFVPGPSL